MTHLIAITLALTATLAMAGYQNIITGAKGLPERLGNTEHPTFEQCIPAGWRIEPTLPPVADGYERLAVTYIEGDGTNAVAVYQDTLIADRLAAEAAAASNAVRLATLPTQFGSGVAVLDADGHWLELVPVGDDVVPIQVSNSPLDPNTRDTLKAAGVLEWGEHRQRITAIEKDLNDVEAQIVSTNWTDVVATNIITTTAVWSNASQRATMIALKDAIQAIKANDNNLKIAVRNLKQAVEKLRREVR